MELSPGETVIFEGRPSWRSILGYYFLGLLAAAAAGVIVALAADTGIGVAVGVGIFVIVVLFGFVRRLFTKYTITTRRLRIRRGVLTRNIQETRVDRLQDHTIRQTIVERILRVGTINFDTAGEQMDMFSFQGVSNPEAIAGKIDQVQRQGDSQALPPETQYRQ